MSWHADGSNKVVSSGPELRRSSRGSGRGHAVWSQGGSGYWLFEVRGAGSGIWIGVTTAQHFKPGYALRGLFYGGPGGNLSDGNSLVSSGHWGHKLSHGDRIGMRLEQAGGRVILAFSRNGAGLGVAFDIRGWSTASQLRPCVSLDEATQALKISSGGPLQPLENMLVAGGVPEAGWWREPGGAAVLYRWSGWVWPAGGWPPRWPIACTAR